MPTPKHRFPLRRQIIWSVRLFTFLTSLAVGAALFVLTDRYVRSNTLQTAEFNLRMVTSRIENNLSSADDLLNWAAVDSTIRHYLSQQELTGKQLINAYETAQEKYLSSPLQAQVNRFFITNETDRFLQYGPLMSTSQALNRESVRQFLTYGIRIANDPLLPGSPQCLVISRSISVSKGTVHRGTVYLGLNLSVITNPAEDYVLPEGSTLYWQMGSRLWQIEDGQMTETDNFLSTADVNYSFRSVRSNASWEQTAAEGRIRLNGRPYIVLRVALDGRGASLLQLLPESTFLQQRGMYLWLIGFGVVLIWVLSFAMQHWLEWSITRPVEALQKRIAAVGAGDFTADPAIEWNNELGDIGRGINKLAGDVNDLLNSRIEDERRKQDLEYRMLQNEVNPHFIYNTLNSIRWMATIQHAPGIAEMVTAFARLTKSISKGTEKLVPLQDELALLNDYFTIQQYRYGGDIEIEVSRIEDETLCRDCMIPRFTLQPLAENAIFHGIEPRGGHGSVLLEIRTDPETGDVLITMTDDGVGMPPELVAHVLDEPTEEAEKQEKFRHVGLWNVHRRIQYSFGEAYGLTLESEEDLGTAVTIRLPYQKKGEHNAADTARG